MDLAKTRSRAKYESIISIILLLVPPSLIFQAQTVLDTLLNPEICSDCHLFPPDTKKGLRQVWMDLNSLRLGYQFCLWLSIIVMLIRMYILCRRPRSFLIYRCAISFRLLCWGGVVPLLVSCSISNGILMDLGESSVPDKPNVTQASQKLKEYLVGLYVSTIASMIFDSCTAYSQLKEIKMAINPSTSIPFGVPINDRRGVSRRNQVRNGSNTNRNGRSHQRSDTLHVPADERYQNPVTRHGGTESLGSLPRLNPRRRNQTEIDSRSTLVNQGQGMLRQAGAFNEPIEDNRPVILDDGQPVQPEFQRAAPPLEMINLQRR